MRRIRSLTAAILVLGVVGSFVASGTAAAQDSDEKLSFVIGTTTGLPTVNPLKGLTSETYYVLGLQYDLAISFAKDDLGPAPGLATEWESSEDGMTWTIKTREGVTWHDGEPFSAEDVAFTYNMIIDNEVGAFVDYFPNVESIEATDANTIVWTASQPTIAPLIPPWVYILPQHIWEPLGTIEDMRAFDNLPPETIGTGPFQLTEYVRNETWTMTKNPDYWGGEPIVDEIIVQKFTNEEAMVSALRTGEIDYAGAMSVNLFNSLEGAEGVTTHVGPATGFDQLSFNMCNPATTSARYCENNPGTGHPSLRDPILRQAISKVIDRELLVERVLGGYGQPGTTIVPPYASTWHVEPQSDTQAYDPAAAAAMLDDAGYVDSDNDGVREDPDTGEPLRFRFFLRSESDENQSAGEFIAQWLSDLGIQTDITVGSTDELTDLWYEHDFDIYIWGWGPDPDPDFILSTFTSGQCGVWSDTCYSNPEYDQLYQDQQVTTTIEERQAVIAEMQQVVYDDVPEVVLYYNNYLEAYRSDRWEGLVESPEPEGFLLYQNQPYSEVVMHPVGMDVGGETGGDGGDGGVVAADEGGSSTGIILAVVGVLIAVVVIVLLMRRGRNDEDLA
jgi:peptide/nickel transport system substrate-binding protein